MLSIIERFGRHYNCYLQSERIVDGQTLKPLYRAGRRWRVGLVMIDGAEELAAIHGTLMMEAASTSEMSVNVNHTTRHNIPEYSHIRNSHLQNLISRLFTAFTTTHHPVLYRVFG